jgi:hypothetical protein
VQVSTVQGLLSLQSWVPVPEQTPAAQTSPVVHELLSLQKSVLSWCRHPETESQLSVVHTLPSSQFRVPTLPQESPPHTSPVVHASPSLHGRLFGVCTQPPVGLQKSVVQGLLSSQSRSIVPVQLPKPQVSLVVQGLSSSQVLVLAAYTQPLVASQLSSEQGLPSSHARTTVPGTQLWSLQTSPTVQASSSLQTLVLAE